jgi:hypothetical protein
MTTTHLGDTLKVLNQLKAEGLIADFAIAGAVAAFRHVSASLTDDLDLLVAFASPAPTGLLTLDPVFDRLAALGYSQFVAEGLVIEGWPVQFLPVVSPLDAEALEAAEPVEIPAGREGDITEARALRAEHVVATALLVGRPKDFLRIFQFLEEGAVDMHRLEAVITRHGLGARWRRFCRRTGVDDPLADRIGE